MLLGSPYLTKVMEDASHKLVDGEDRDRLIHILESSLQVRKSSHFFAWTQGPLQSLIPHEILICGHDPLGHGALKLRYYTATRYFKQEHFEAACNSHHGLIVNTIRHWREAHRPCLQPDHNGGIGACEIASEELLTRLELKNMAAHGLLGPNGEVHFWFCLSRVRHMNAKTAHLLELLLPCISATYARMVAMESSNHASSARVSSLLTPRETQVLELVRDGLSNANVAARLTLSVMTAKNHVQNIRKKLDARTRGQAVAEAIRLGFIRPEREET
jgi:transcriptional regulator EpsA